MMSAMPETIIDLDALLADEFAVAAENPTKTVRLFGREWEVDREPNAYRLISATGDRDEDSDPKEMMQALIAVVREDQRADFEATLRLQRNLTADLLMSILNAIVEAGTEHPTEPPSESSDTSTTPDDGQRSEGASSSPDGTPTASPSAG